MSTPDPTDELIRRHWRRLAGFLRKLGAPEQEIDDLIQEVWLRVLRVPNWDGDIPLLLRIARQRWLDALQRKKPVIDAEVVALVAAPPAPEVADEARRLAKCLDKLRQANERFHAAVVAFYYDARADDEVAAEQAVAPATIRSGRHKALAALRTCLGVSPE